MMLIIGLQIGVLIGIVLAPFVLLLWSLCVTASNADDVIEKTLLDELEQRNQPKITGTL